MAGLLPRVRRRREQKGERRREGGDPLEDEEIYPHYDIDGNDDENAGAIC